MTPDPRRPIEPAPRFPDGPPAFVPPPHGIAAVGGGSSHPFAPSPRGPVPRAGVAALIAAVVALAFYAWGAAPTVLPGDSAELAAVAFKGGVPHPTGYPTFVLLGQVAGALIGGDPAHRITLLCAFAGAGAVALFALVLAELGLGWGAILGGALFYAGTFTLWWASIRVEVYSPAIALAMFALWRVLVARRTLAARDGLLAAFAIGLALTGHLSFGPALALAGLALAVRARRARALSPLLAVGALVMLVLGFSPYLYLVYADQRYTLTNYLRFCVEPAGGQFGLTPETMDGTFDRMRFLLFGAESHPHDFIHHLPTALTNLGVAWARFAAFEVGPLGLLLALGGEGALAHRDRGAARLLAAIALFTPVFGALVVDGALLGVFMMATTIAVAALAACGMDVLLARGGGRAPLAVALAVALIVVPHELRVRINAHPQFVPWLRMLEEGPPHLTTFVPQFRHERTARVRAEHVLAALPESSFVAARWDEVMVMKYLQSAEGVRTDVHLDPWYEPAHTVRLAYWRRHHPLVTHPVVMVGIIPGLADRLMSPQMMVVDSTTLLFVERHRVRVP